jgi:hypothetical protein
MGRTWHEIMQNGPHPTSRQSVALAVAFVDVMAQLEQEGIAHGDLSGSNLLIRGIESQQPVIELVDVEQLFAPGMSQLSAFPSSSPGYGYQPVSESIWEPAMDRFAGAILLSEILGWCDENVRAAASGETYFAEGELQQPCQRYQILHATLAERWSDDIADLLARAWVSDVPGNCPSFGEWQIALSKETAKSHDAVLATWIAAGQSAMARRDWAAALAAYKTALTLAEPESGLAQEIPLIIAGLETKPGNNKRQAPLEPTGQSVAASSLEPERKKTPWLWLLAPLLLLFVAGLVYVVARALNTDEAAQMPAPILAIADSAVAATLIPAPTKAPPTSSEAPTEAEGVVAAPAATDTTVPRATRTPRSTATPRPSRTAGVTPSPTATRLPANTTNQVAGVGNGLPLGFETFGAWGRGDKANGTFRQSSSQAHEGAFAARLDYSFGTDDDDTVMFFQENPIDGAPNAIQVWVKGDGRGHFLNVWIIDADGETWQVPFGQVNHEDWAQMTAYINPSQDWPWRHISGPDNGQVDYPIRFRGFMLDDVNSAYQGRGTIYLDDLRALSIQDLPAASQPTNPDTTATPGPSNTPKPATAVPTTQPLPTDVPTLPPTAIPTVYPPPSTAVPTTYPVPPTSEPAPTSYPYP